MRHGPIEGWLVNAHAETGGHLPQGGHDTAKAFRPGGAPYLVHIHEVLKALSQKLQVFVQHANDPILLFEETHELAFSVGDQGPDVVRNGRCSYTLLPISPGGEL